MSEPPAKKIKLSGEGDDPDVINMAGNEPYDRVLLVGYKKFGVQSEKLIERSEYFRVMFTGPFSENNKKEITIKDVHPDLMELVLNIFLRSNSDGINGDNLQDMIDLFVYFLATPFFFNVLAKNKILEKFAPEELFPRMKGFPELQDYLDKILTAEFLARFPLERRRSRAKVRNFKFDVRIMKSIMLAHKHSLSNLKNAVDSELATQYKTINQVANVTKKFMELMNKYELPSLMIVMEDELMEKYRKGECSFDVIAKAWTESPNMKNLQAVIENYYIERFNESKEEKTRRLDYDDLSYYLEICHKYELHNLKDLVDTFVAMKCENMAVEYTNLTMRIFLNLAYSSNLTKLKVAIETQQIRKFIEDKNTLTIGNIDQLLEMCGRYEMQKVKEEIENHLIEKFNKTKDSLDIEEIERLLISCICYELQELKTVIETFFVWKSQNIDVENRKLVIEEFSRLAFNHDLPTLKEHMLNLLVEEFKLDRKLSFVVWLLISYDLPKLKGVVDEYLLDSQQADNSELEEIIEETLNYGTCFGHFTDTIGKYFIRQFHMNHNFKRVKLAFDEKFEEFKDCVAEFLKTATLDDPIMIASREHILELEADEQNFLFHSLLRKHA